MFFGLRPSAMKGKDAKKRDYYIDTKTHKSIKIKIRITESSKFEKIRNMNFKTRNECRHSVGWSWFLDIGIWVFFGFRGFVFINMKWIVVYF
jgi:hypothetical protein